MPNTSTTPSVPPRKCGPILNFFENLSEWATRFVSSHWGTLTAFTLFVIGSAVFVSMDGTPLASILEKLMTMISLVLLFMLQRAQSKDTKTLQIKLNELLASHEQASDSMINIEDLNEDQIESLRHRFKH